MLLLAMDKMSVRRLDKNRRMGLTLTAVARNGADR